MERKAFEVPPRPKKNGNTFSNNIDTEVLPPAGKQNGTVDKIKPVPIFDLIDGVKDVAVSISSVLEAKEETKQMQEKTLQLELLTSAAINEQQQETERKRLEYAHLTESMQLQMQKELQVIEAKLLEHQREWEVRVLENERNYESKRADREKIEENINLARTLYEEYSRIVLNMYKNGQTPHSSLEEEYRKSQTFLLEMTRMLREEK